MKTVQLDKKRPIKINFQVLEDFEELTGADAMAFNARNVKQLRVMTGLALKAADPSFDMSDDELKECMTLNIIEPILDAFLTCAFGKDYKENIPGDEDVGE